MDLQTCKMFEELRHSTKLPYLRNERCTTVLNVIAVCPQKIMGVEKDPIFFWNSAKFFRGNRTVKHRGVYLSKAPLWSPAKGTMKDFFFEFQGEILIFLKHF